MRALAQDFRPDSRVFSVHPIKNDISPAANFGQIVYVNHGYVYGDEVNDFSSALPEEHLQRMQLAVQEFDPDNDYLLIAGDHLQLLAFAAALGSVHRRFRVLRWDRHAEGYFPVCIRVNDKGFLIPT